MKQMVFRMTATNRFEVVVRQIRKKLEKEHNLKGHESVYCYIGNVFSPALDETVENLWRVSIFFLAMGLRIGGLGWVGG